eukprot:3940578-Rhodomonas_salina.3
MRVHTSPFPVIRTIRLHVAPSACATSVQDIASPAQRQRGRHAKSVPDIAKEAHWQTPPYASSIRKSPRTRVDGFLEDTTCAGSVPGIA